MWSYNRNKIHNFNTSKLKSFPWFYYIIYIRKKKTKSSQVNPK